MTDMGRIAVGQLPPLSWFRILAPAGLLQLIFASRER